MKLRHVVFALALAGAMGCKNAPEPAPPPPPDSPDGVISDLTPVARGGAEFHTPLDATPSPDGTTAYFAAIGPNGPAIFKASVEGGAVQVLAEGGGLVSPFGLDVGSDGATLFITDPGAQIDEADKGIVFTLPTGGGAPTPLAGTEGYAAKGVCVVPEPSGDVVYFSGVDASGEAGIFKVGASGGQVTAVKKGEPFVDPSGVAVARDGDVWAVDTAGPSGAARLLRVSGGQATEVLSELAVGYPAGVALSLRDGVVLVSALDPQKRTDAVIRYVIAAGEVEQISTGIDAFAEPAGLHRAKNVDSYIWADSAANHDARQADGAGTVYVINKQ